MPAGHELLLFSGSDRELLRRCQALRYRVYHSDLGLQTPDLDHAAGLDIEARDADCDFAAVLDVERREIVGCLRMQPPGRGRYYGELEFELAGPTWQSRRFVEGARFAVAKHERNGPVPLALYLAFRRYCRERSIDDVLAVAIAPGVRTDRAKVARLTRFLTARTDVALERGRPAVGYELEPPSEEELAAAGAPRAGEVTPMMQLLANRRTTLASRPAYCRRFGTFNFLLTTRLS